MKGSKETTPNTESDHRFCGARQTAVADDGPDIARTAHGGGGGCTMTASLAGSVALRQVHAPAATGRRRLRENMRGPSTAFAAHVLHRAQSRMKRAQSSRTARLRGTPEHRQQSQDTPQLTARTPARRQRHGGLPTEALRLPGHGQRCASVLLSRTKTPTQLRNVTGLAWVSLCLFLCWIIWRMCGSRRRRLHDP